MPVDPAAVFCAVSYWRKSLWNGIACAPVVLTLEGGRLRMVDRKGAGVFDVGLDAVSGRLTGLGTLMLDVAGTGYALVGRGAQFSPAIRPEQHRAMQDFWAHHPLPSFQPARPGFFDSVFNESSIAQMKIWKQALEGSGVSFS